jgi:cytidylate kinase
VIVAIDGPAGAGKSTLARSLAQKLGFTYIDTGAMYRAVALWALRVGVDLDDLHRLEQLAKEARIEFTAGETTVLLNGEDVTAAIREPRVSEAASKVSLAPGVRRAMRNEQRRIGSLHSVVMEGRDIGTVVFPDAQVKVYLDADPQVRAGRRAAETGGAVEQIARDNGRSASEVIEHFREQPGRLAELRAHLKHEKAREVLRKASNVIDETPAFTPGPKADPAPKKGK